MHPDPFKILYENLLCLSLQLSLQTDQYSISIVLLHKDHVHGYGRQSTVVALKPVHLINLTWRDGPWSHRWHAACIHIGTATSVTDYGHIDGTLRTCMYSHTVTDMVTSMARCTYNTYGHKVIVDLNTKGRSITLTTVLVVFTKK